MRRILEEFYFGNINPSERSYIRDSAYGKAVQTMTENEEKLTELLEGKEKKSLSGLPCVFCNPKTNEPYRLHEFYYLHKKIDGGGAALGCLS